AADKKILKLLKVGKDRERGPLTLKDKEHTEEVESCLFSPNSKLLATHNYGGGKVWEGAEDKVTSPKKVMHNIGGVYETSVAFSPDSKLLIVGGGNTVQRWHTQGRELSPLKGETPLKKPFDEEIKGVVFSPHSRLLVSWSLEGAVTLWDVLADQEET